MALRRVPDVLGLTVLGILLGPVTGAVPAEAFGQAGPVLTTIALSVLLFESGTNLRLQTIFAGMRHLVLLTLVTAVCTATIVAVAAAIFGGLPWISAALLGAIVSGTSSAVVIPMVRSLAVGEPAATVLTLESAVTDVLAIVATFALLTTATAASVDFGIVIGQVVASFAVASAIGVAAGLLWLTAWSYVRGIPNALFTTLALGFVIFGVAEVFGFSGAIAVLAFGVTLANFRWLERWPAFKERNLQGITSQEQAFYQEMVFLLKTFFFVFLGISMQFNSLLGTAAAVLVLLVVYAVRLLVTRWTTPEWNRRDRRITSFMIPKGLAAAVLAGVPLQAGIAGGETIRDLAHQIVFSSIVMTAILGALTDTPLFRRIYSRLLVPKTIPTGTGESDEPRQPV